MLHHEDTKSFPATGRLKTDKSLSTERAKSDQKILENAEKAERQADKNVSRNRAEADERKSVARTDLGDQGTDALLLKERRNSDRAIEAERRQMDSELEKERNAKKAVQEELLQTERKETDRNLTDERRQADSDALKAARVLSEEKTRHGAAKVALTTRDEFLAIVSHDLRNPLSAISMATDLLHETMPEGTGTEIREYLDLIQRNASEAVRLITDLLDIEQIAAGKLGLQVACHDLTALAQHLVKSCQLLASTKNQSIQLRTSHASLLVECDQDRILQVLGNLVGNAIKFTPDGGTITLTIEALAEGAHISVADSGPGIEQDMQKIIFDRFWQIGKQDRRGLGLGLYISKMIVEGHGGSIWVDSKSNNGSTFHVRLP